MSNYLEGKMPSNDELRALIRKGTIAVKFFPMFCGSAFKNKGVQPLLDARRRLSCRRRSTFRRSRASTRRPTPKSCASRRQRAAVDAGLQDHERPVRRFADLLPHLFRQDDQGRLARQHRQGQEGAHRPHAADARQFARRHRRGFCRRHRRAGRPQGSHHRRHAVRPAEAGHPRAHGIPGAGHPDRHRAEDQGRPGKDGPRAATAWPPRIRPSASRPTKSRGQTIIAGMGELHLDILVDRMRREFKVEANVGAPQVAYRETITRKHEQDYTHKKQTGGTGQFARVKIVFEPNPEGEDFVFEIEDRRRRGAEGIHPGRREGHRQRPVVGSVRRLPDDRRQGDADRRRLPRRRLLGAGLRNRRPRAASAKRRRSLACSCSSRS